MVTIADKTNGSYGTISYLCILPGDVLL